LTPEKPTILIVDDEMDLRFFLSTLFETSGFTAMAARDGRDGMRLARERRPGLIVLDIMMPGEGGAVMYKALKGDPQLAPIPVIMLSAVDANAFRHYLTMLNAQSAQPVPPPAAYMEKPPDPDALLALARKVLGAH
jgi:two-component system phosphate regulon response regulator PhoB